MDVRYDVEDKIAREIDDLVRRVRIARYFSENSEMTY